MVRPGFVDVYPFNVFPSDDIIPDVHVHEKYPIVEVSISVSLSIL